MSRLFGKIKDWANGFQARIDGGGFGCKVGSGQFGTSQGKGKVTLDKKEVNVWKLPESLSKPGFRFWLDAVDNSAGGDSRFLEARDRFGAHASHGDFVHKCGVRPEVQGNQ